MKTFIEQKILKFLKTFLLFVRTRWGQKDGHMYILYYNISRHPMDNIYLLKIYI